MRGLKTIGRLVLVGIASLTLFSALTTVLYAIRHGVTPILPLMLCVLYSVLIWVASK